MRRFVMTLAGVMVAATLTGGCPLSGDNLTNDPTARAVAFTSGTPNQTRTGDSTAGTEFDSTCQGFFPTTPNHILDIEESTSLEIRISGDAGVRVLLQAGQSKFCATPDDALLRFFTRGELEVFVGADEAGKTVNYTLEFVR